jgi:ATP-dependent exoDNAse (exonuclease V) beta subunit
LQRIAEDELRGWDAKRVDVLRQSFSKELARRGVLNRDLKVSAEFVATALKNSISDERGRWVLGQHADSRSEHRIRVHGAGRSVTYVVDRIFRTTDGSRWIVDYKSSRHEGARLQEFLDEERTRYETQLNTYANSFGVEQLGLYFPLLRAWREWRR